MTTTQETVAQKPVSASFAKQAEAMLKNAVEGLNEQHRTNMETRHLSAESSVDEKGKMSCRADFQIVQQRTCLARILGPDKLVANIEVSSIPNSVVPGHGFAVMAVISKPKGKHKKVTVAFSFDKDPATIPEDLSGILQRLANTAFQNRDLKLPRTSRKPSFKRQIIA
ncbi:MAG: hypothetical protein WCD70_09400 [Alphaproteobacteria bacterium]